jgi:hypothetical protein
VTRWYARLAVLTVLVGLVAGAPCPCAAAPATDAADHCGTSAPGIRAAHGGCACPCMTSSDGDMAAERPEAAARAPLAPGASASPPRAPGVALILPTPRAQGAPERAMASPPSVLRI